MPSDPCQWRLGDLIRSGDPLALKRHWTGPASHSGIMLDRHGWQAPGVSAIAKRFCESEARASKPGREPTEGRRTAAAPRAATPIAQHRTSQSQRWAGHAWLERGLLEPHAATAGPASRRGGYWPRLGCIEAEH
jgi:hypothetical protein